MRRDIAEPSSDIPSDFDPCAQPILAQHWFGVEIKTSTHTNEAKCIGVDREAA